MKFGLNQILPKISAISLISNRHHISELDQRFRSRKSTLWFEDNDIVTFRPD